MVGRTHGIHAEPTTFGVKLALWALQVRRDRERLRAGPRRRSRSASSRARSARTPTSIPSVERYVCERARPHAGAGHAGAAARPPRRGALRVRVDRARASSRSRSRSATSSAPRCARPRRRSARAAEGLERDAAQAQPDQVGAAVRAGPRAARQPAGRARRRRAVARARHLALVGRAHHRPRLAACSPTTCSCRCTTVVDEPAGASRADAAQPRRVVRARVQPAGAARAGRGRARAATTRTGSCSATRCRRGRNERSFRELLATDAEVTRGARRRDARRVLRPRSARSPTSAALRRRSTTRESCRRERRSRLPHLYSGKVRELYEVGHDRAADGRERPRLGVRRRAARRDPRQGPGAHRRVARSGSTSTADIVPNHVISRDPTDFPEVAARRRRAGRCSCARTRPIRLECVVRGYLFGTAGRSTASRARSAAVRCRPGCSRPSSCPSRCSRRRPRPTTGHDLPLTATRRSTLVGADASTSSCATSRCALYERGARARASARLILADTKFEFGELDGEMLVIDEMMTPDSSRYWPLEDVQARRRRRRRSTSSTCATHGSAPAGTTSRPRRTCPPR